MQGDLYSVEGKSLTDWFLCSTLLGEDRINNSEIEVGKKSFYSK